MKCDHALIQTKFCPDCGEPVGADPAMSLLAHVRKMHRRLQDAKGHYPQRDRRLVAYAQWIAFIEESLAARRVKPEGNTAAGAKGVL